MNSDKPDNHPPQEVQAQQSSERSSPAAPRSNCNGSETLSDAGSPSEVTILRQNTTPTVMTMLPRKQSMSSRRESVVQMDSERPIASENTFEQDGGDNSQEQQIKRRKVEDQMSSCETCKHRKVKCDRTQPSCFRCQRSKQECIYKQKKKPGLRAGIGRELEERLDRVESMLATHAQILKQQATKLHHIHSSSNPSSRSHMSSPGSPMAAASYHDAHRHGGIPMTMNSGYLTSRPIPHNRENEASTSPGNSTNTSHYHIRSYSSSHMDLDVPVSFPQEQSIIEGMGSFDPELPPDDILLHLIETYFIHIHPSIPILHRETITNTYFPRSRAVLHPNDIILLFAITFAAIRFSTDRRIDDRYKKSFRKVAKQKVIINAMENPSIQSLRAMVITAMDVVGSTNGPAGWGLIAFTSRMAMHLGLNTEPSNSPVYGPNGNENGSPAISTWAAGSLPESKDWIEQEGRRRLFWAVYILDIYTSLGTSLDLTLDEREIERLLPCQDEIWDSNQPTVTRWYKNPCQEMENNINNMHTLSAFSFRVEIMGLLGQIHQFLRKTIDINNLNEVNEWQTKYRSLDKALSSWKYSLPMQYGNLTRALTLGQRTFEPGWVLLHAAYNTAVIRLHSVAAYPTKRSALFGPSYSAGQRCLSAVENVAALTRIVFDNNMLNQLGSIFAFTLWASARLVLVHASTTDYPMIPDIRLFLNALNEMGKSYETAGRYASILQKVVDELAGTSGGSFFRRDKSMPNSKPASNCGHGQYSPQSNGGSPDSSINHNSCVEILADMRRTAFAVDVLISQHSGASKPHSESGNFDATSNGDSFRPFPFSEGLTQTSMQMNSSHNHLEAQNQDCDHVPPPPGPLSPNPHISTLAEADSQANDQSQIAPTLQAMEYMDVFNWFNLRKVAGTVTNVDAETSSMENTNSTNTPIQTFQALASTQHTDQNTGEWLFRS